MGDGGDGETSGPASGDGLSCEGEDSGGERESASDKREECVEKEPERMGKEEEEREVGGRGVLVRVGALSSIRRRSEDGEGEWDEPLRWASSPSCGTFPRRGFARLVPRGWSTAVRGSGSGTAAAAGCDTPSWPFSCRLGGRVFCPLRGPLFGFGGIDASAVACSTEIV